MCVHCEERAPIEPERGLADCLGTPWTKQNRSSSPFPFVLGTSVSKCTNWVHSADQPETYKCAILGQYMLLGIQGFTRGPNVSPALGQTRLGK